MFRAELIEKKVWYVYDAKGNIVATLDDTSADRPRSDELMEREAKIMAAALNCKSNMVYVLCNSCGPVAAYDNEDAAYAMMCKVENNPRQQNNHIEDFRVNVDPHKRELLA